jgi:hypothetical protein
LNLSACDAAVLTVRFPAQQQCGRSSLTQSPAALSRTTASRALQCRVLCSVACVTASRALQRRVRYSVACFTASRALERRVLCSVACFTASRALERRVLYSVACFTELAQRRASSLSRRRWQRRRPESRTTGFKRARGSESDPVADPQAAQASYRRCSGLAACRLPALRTTVTRCQLATYLLRSLSASACSAASTPATRLLVHLSAISVQLVMTHQSVMTYLLCSLSANTCVSASAPACTLICSGYKCAFSHDVSVSYDVPTT